ncbi:hypothetical protein BS17DRAFT_446648 [Gyrodon lividus]|nr:hypothetical protein BS17DRAFT_446648 [Gyrodon lividus]
MTAITTASASGVQYVDQKPMFATYDEQPPMDSLPYPPPPNFQPSPTPQDGVVLGAPSYIHNAPFQISTSNEEWEDVPAPPPRLTVPSQPYMLSELPSPSQTAFSLPQHEQYTSSSYSHSRRRRSRSPSPRSQLRMSPIPHTKRSLDKKPALACLFCRGRKIACGPPSPGSKDKTCNQCLRRHLKCEYPLESRRGMRKRRSLVPRATSATPELSQGPKVHLTKANRKRSTEKAS